MKNITSAFAVATLAMVPFAAQAQFGGINDFIGDISSFINNVLIPLIFAVALLFFLYGVFSFLILSRDDDDAKKNGRDYMIWSVVGFVVMVSIFGIVNLIADGLGFSDDQNLNNIPDAPTSNR